MNVDDLYGTLYVPKDGTMDPAGTCTTLSRAASARGAMVMRTDLLTASFWSFKVAATLQLTTLLSFISVYFITIYKEFWSFEWVWTGKLY